MVQWPYVASRHAASTWHFSDQVLAKHGRISSTRIHWYFGPNLGATPNVWTVFHPSFIVNPASNHGLPVISLGWFLIQAAPASITISERYLSQAFGLSQCNLPFAWSFLIHIQPPKPSGPQPIRQYLIFWMETFLPNTTYNIVVHNLETLEEQSEYFQHNFASTSTVYLPLFHQRLSIEIDPASAKDGLWERDLPSRASEHMNFKPTASYASFTAFWP